MIPKSTPHTASRKTRSQSPPRRTQRTPVSQMQAAIAASSISPYMCRTSGPMWTTPVCGEGMLSSTRGMLKEDLEGELLCAAAAQEVAREVKLDVVPRGDRRRRTRVEARPLQLLSAPALDHRHFVYWKLEFCRGHFDHSPLVSSSPVRRQRLPPGRGIRKDLRRVNGSKGAPACGGRVQNLPACWPFLRSPRW